MTFIMTNGAKFLVDESAYFLNCNYVPIHLSNNIMNND